MKPLKLVIDTNVWISFFINNKFVELTELILNQNHTVFTSFQLKFELETVLMRPKFSKYLKKSISEYTTLHNNLTETKVIIPSYTNSPDPDDNFLFDLAIQHNGDFIVTGDKLLLNFKHKENFKIITLKTFKELGKN